MWRPTTDRLHDDLWAMRGRSDDHWVMGGLGAHSSSAGHSDHGSPRGAELVAEMVS